MNKANQNVLVTLTIHGAADMLKETRKNIEAWLKAEGKMLVKEGKDYAKRFTGRYFTFPVK